MTATVPSALQFCEVLPVPPSTVRLLHRVGAMLPSVGAAAGTAALALAAAGIASPLGSEAYAQAFASTAATAVTDARTPAAPPGPSGVAPYDAPPATPLGFDIDAAALGRPRERIFLRVFRHYGRGSLSVAERLVDSLLVLAQADAYHWGNTAAAADLARYRLARARILETQLKLPEALDALRGVIAESDAEDDPGLVARAYLLRELVFEQAEKPAFAREALAEAGALIRANGLDDLRGQYYMRAASCYRVFDMGTEAARRYADSARAATAGGRPSYEASAAHWLTAALMPDDGDAGARLAHLDTAAQLSFAIGDSLGYAYGLVSIAEELRGDGRVTEATARLRTALGVAEAVLARGFVDKRYLAGAYELQAELLEVSGRPTRALAAFRRGHELALAVARETRDEEVYALEERFRSDQAARARRQEASLLAVEQRRRRQLGLAAVVLAGLLAVVAGYAVRLRATRQRVREEVAQQRVLRAEIQHRVKNNLQVLISLLEARAFSIGDAAVAAEFEEMAGRVHSLAAVHELLDGYHDAGAVAAGPYVASLIDHFRALHAGTLDIDVDVAELRLSPRRLIPIGLVVHELLTNSVKHARPADGRLAIRLSLRADGDAARFGYGDSGRGPKLERPGKAALASGRLGGYLIDSMVRQLRGRLLAPAPGEDFAFRFDPVA